MGLTIEMIVILHKKTKDKINLIYKKPGGRTGYCYLDPSQPIGVGKSPQSYGTLLTHLKLDDWKGQDVYVTFYKQQSNVRLMLNLKDVEFQNKNKEAILQLIYGTN